MKAGVVNNFILNGFDRSGTSAISRTIATHPDIEIIMQPFNSGSIRQKLYQVIDDDNATDADYDFFKKLEKGILEPSYIKSEWHQKHSSTKSFKDEKLHLIKTTQNHFTIDWVKQHFPEIEHWGIWRDPVDILASLVRNNFHIKWYSGAVNELVETVRRHEVLNVEFSSFIDQLTNPIREMAFIIAVRSWFYFRRLDSNKIIYYSTFVQDHNEALVDLIEYFELSSFDFDMQEKGDLNIIGKKYNSGSRYRSMIPNDDFEFCDAVFNSLNNLISK